MNKETLEHLSSLMDGELTQETGLFLTRRMSTNKELGAKWERYHLIRDCLRQPGSRCVATGLTLDIAEAGPPATRDAATADPRTPAPRLRVASGTAIAASVAAVALLVAVQRPEAPGVDSVEAAAQPFSSPNVIGAGPISQPASFGGQDPANQRRLNNYLLRHNQAAGSVSPQGFITFVPIVTNGPGVSREEEIAPMDAASQAGAELPADED